MHFETTDRIIAVAPEAVETLFPQLLAQYGEELPDAGRQVLTIGGHWDDAAQTRIRAASLTDGTITGQPLTDGRVAFRCLWQTDLAAAFDAGDIEGVAELTAAFDRGDIESVAELTAEELTSLTPPPTE